MIFHLVSLLLPLPPPQSILNTETKSIILKHSTYHITPLLKTKQLPHFTHKSLQQLRQPSLNQSLLLSFSLAPCLKHTYSSNAPGKLPTYHYCAGSSSVWNALLPGSGTANSFVFLKSLFSVFFPVGPPQEQHLKFQPGSSNSWRAWSSAPWSVFSVCQNPSRLLTYATVGCFNRSTVHCLPPPAR